MPSVRTPEPADSQAPAFHLAPVAGVTVAPNGQILSVSYDGALCAWRREGSQLRNQHRRMLHVKGVNCVAASSDGRRAVTGASDGRGCIIDLIEPSTPELVLEQPVDIECAVFSADGRFILTGGTDGNAKIWDAHSGRLLHTIHHGKTVGAVTLVGDPALVATGCNDRKVRLIEWETGKVVHTAQHHEGPVKALAWTRKGLVSAAHDSRLVLMDASLGLIEVVHTFTTTPKTVAAEPGGGAFWVGCYDQTLSRWVASEGDARPSFRRVRQVSSARMWAHGLVATEAEVIIGSFDGAPIVFDSTGAGEPSRVSGPEPRVPCISSLLVDSASGKIFAGGDSGEIRLVTEPPKGPKGAVPSIHYAEVSGAITSLAGTAKDFVCGAWDSTLTRFVDGQVRWKAKWANGTEHGPSPIIRTDRNDSRAVVGLYTGGAACFSLEDGRLLWEQKEATGAVKCVSIRGDLYAMTGRYDPLRVGRHSDGQILARLPLETPVSDQVRFSPFSQPGGPLRLAVGAGPHEVWIVDVHQEPGGQVRLEVVTRGTGHKLPVKALAWVDANTVASGCYGGRIIVHRVGGPSQQIGMVDSRLGLSALEADGREWVWASFDGSVGRIALPGEAVEAK